MVIDWSILRPCCILDLSVDSGHFTEPTGHLQFLPCEHLSGYCRPEWIQYLEFPSSFPSPILPANLCGL